MKYLAFFAICFLTISSVCFAEPVYIFVEKDITNPSISKDNDAGDVIAIYRGNNLAPTKAEQDNYYIVKADLTREEQSSLLAHEVVPELIQKTVSWPKELENDWLQRNPHKNRSDYRVISSEDNGDHVAITFEYSQGKIVRNRKRKLDISKIFKDTPYTNQEIKEIKIEKDNLFINSSSSDVYSDE